jgi:hypothetical protein
MRTFKVILLILNTLLAGLNGGLGNYITATVCAVAAIFMGIDLILGLSDDA